MARRSHIGVLLLTAFGLARALQAQTVETRDAAPDLASPVKRELGFGLLLAEPVGEFDRYVGAGGGFRLSGVLHFGERRALGIRLDGTLISYGKTTERRALAAVPRIDLDVTTENSIGTFAIGPQLLIGHGSVRPHARAMIGSSQFVTTTSVWSGGLAVPIASVEEFEDYALLITVGGGVRIALSERRRRPIVLELDGSYLHHGRTEYLREGGLRELPDGSVEIDPITSDANLLTFSVGVLIGFR